MVELGGGGGGGGGRGEVEGGGMRTEGIQGYWAGIQGILNIKGGGGGNSRAQNKKSSMVSRVSEQYTL